MSDLVEKVTRALDTWVDPEKVRDAIAVVLEEAAKVAIASHHYGGHSIAVAIRALKEK